jgi:hypothetical protein
MYIYRCWLYAGIALPQGTACVRMRIASTAMAHSPARRQKSLGPAPHLEGMRIIPVWSSLKTTRGIKMSRHFPSTPDPGVYASACWLAGCQLSNVTTTQAGAPAGQLAWYFLPAAVPQCMQLRPAPGRDWRVTGLRATRG